MNDALTNLSMGKAPETQLEKVLEPLCYWICHGPADQLDAVANHATVLRSSSSGNGGYMKKNRQPFNGDINTLLIILSFTAVLGLGVLAIAMLVVYFNERKCYRISRFQDAIAKFHVRVEDH